MESGNRAPSGPRCTGTTKFGKPCQALAGSDGLCSAHSGRLDMKELGARGGRANGHVKPEQMPQSLREELRTLDPKIVRAAVEQALAGGNEAARVSAVKLLADIDAFGRDGTCPVCAKTAALDKVALRARLAQVIEAQVEQRAEEITKDLRERTRELEGQLAALRQEHATA